MNIFSKELKLKKSKKKGEISNSYHYNIECLLDNVYTDSKQCIYLCFYFIDNKRPILRYFLEKNSNQLSFFKLLRNPDIPIKSSTLSYIENNFNSEFKIKGYKLYENNIFMFVELNQQEENNLGEWCIIDELCNKKKFLDMPICEFVSDFFLNNPNFIYLTNKNGLKIEIPIVGFKNAKDLMELMYFKYNNNNSNTYYDYDHCNKNNVLRYILFITIDSLIFDKHYQYMVNYKSKAESIHK